MDKFKVFGLDENATKEELQKKYEQLKEKYEKGMLQSGKRGQNAANKLQQLHDDYYDCLEQIELKERNHKDVYEYIEELINQKDYTKAQQELDNIVSKGAKWHYYQARLFEKRDWIEQAILQADLAIKDDQNERIYAEYKAYLEGIIKTKEEIKKAAETQDNNRAGYEKPEGGSSISPACCLLPLCCC